MDHWLKIILVVIIGGIWPLFSEAATTVALQTNNRQTVVGDLVEVTVDLIFDSLRMNAIEGSLFVPDDQLEIIEVRAADSPIKLWIRPPLVDGAVIRYAGIIPGEIVADRLRLFTLQLRPRTSGIAEMRFAPQTVLAADGLASPLPVSTQNLRITIRDHEAGWYVFWVVSGIVVVGSIATICMFTRKRRSQR